MLDTQSLSKHLQNDVANKWTPNQRNHFENRLAVRMAPTSFLRPFSLPCAYVTATYPNVRSGQKGRLLLHGTPMVPSSTAVICVQK